jgi:hypothetical protein
MRFLLNNDWLTNDLRFSQLCAVQTAHSPFAIFLSHLIQAILLPCHFPFHVSPGERTDGTHETEGRAQGLPRKVGLS